MRNSMMVRYEHELKPNYYISEIRGNLWLILGRGKRATMNPCGMFVDGNFDTAVLKIWELRMYVHVCMYVVNIHLIGLFIGVF